MLIRENGTLRWKPEVLTESGLSRIAEHLGKYYCGTITAFRDEYNRDENRARNRNLLAKLQNEGFGVTRIKGGYIQDYKSDKAKKVSEESFFVVDFRETGKLESSLAKFGEEFEQDSVLVIPTDSKPFLLGTKEDAWPGLGQKNYLQKVKMGYEGEFFSAISGRPFIFSEEIKSFPMPNGSCGRWACSEAAKKSWRA